MARNIRGITIEIDGSTTKLTAALKDVNNTIKYTQSSLRDVNRLLKLDPTSTTLLQQKQKLLKSAISETKDKLVKLKDAQKQAKAQLESGDLGADKYDALQREIEETEQALKNLQDQSDDFGGVMSQKLQATGDKMKDLGGKISDIGTTMTTRVTAPIVAAGGVVASKYAEVDKTMQLTNQTMENSAEDAEKLQKAMEDAASNSIFGMSDAATAALNFARAGLDATEAADALAPAMNLAAGEGGNLDTVSAGLVATINGFGDEFGNAGKYADVFAEACNNSALDVDSLSSAMSTAAPTFSAAGYSVEDAALYMGVMANAGIGAEEAATSLKTGMARLVNPTKDAKKWMEKLGIEVTNADGSMKDSVEIQKDLHDSFDGLTESEKLSAGAALFGKNQMDKWLALIGTSPDEVSALDDSLRNCSGTTQEMSDAMMDGFGGSIERLKSSLDVLMTSLGEFVAGYLAPVIEKVQGVIDSLNNMDDAQKQNIVRIAAMVAAIGPLLVVLGKGLIFVGNITSAIGKIAPALKHANTAFAGLKGAIAGISAPIAIIVAVIGTLVAAFVHLWNTNEEFRDKIISIWNGIVDSVKGFIDKITSHFEDLGINFDVTINGIKSLWEDFCNFLAPVFEGAFSVLAGIIQGALDAILLIVDFFIGFFTGDWETFLGDVQDIFGDAWNAVCGFFGGIADKLGDIMTGIKDSLIGKMSAAKDTVVSKVSELKEKAVTFFSETASAAKEKFETLRSNVSTKISSAKETVASKAAAIKETISDKFSSAAETAKSKFETLKTNVSTKISSAKDAVADKATAIRESISSKFGSAAETAKSKFETIKSNITSKMSAAKDSVASKASAIKDSIASKFGSAADSAKSKFETLRSGIVDKMTSAKEKISNIVSAIKGFFSNMKLSIPKISLPKLPHFSLTGSFSLMPPSVPKLSVSWYAKAMDNGMILNRPTIFGYSGGHYLGAGEAGSETVVGTRSLMDMIRQTNGSGETAEAINRMGAEMLAMMQRYYPLMADNKVLVDTAGTGVINRQLYQAATAEGRYR